MTEQKSYKPVGGVIAAELFLVSDIASTEDVVEGGGIAVTLVDDGSSYEERFLSDEGLVSVQHTLTLCCSRNDAVPWLDARFVRLCAAEGVVARVVLATGEQVVVGWSQRFGFEQALRLEQMRFWSGEKPTDAPQVELRLVCHDTHSSVA